MIFQAIIYVFEMLGAFALLSAFLYGFATLLENITYIVVRYMAKRDEVDEDV